MKSREADRVTLIIFELFMGAMSVACGAILMAGLADNVLGMHTSLLDGTWFGSFFIPGLILAVAVGGSQFLAAYGLWRREPWDMVASFATGIVLMGWIVVEVLLLGWIAPHGLQPFCFAYGAIESVMAVRYLRVPVRA